MRNLYLILITGLALWGGVRVNIAIGAGHPVHRPRTVIVQRPPLVVAPRVVYAPAVVWAPTAVVIRPRHPAVWEDTEILRRADDWVDFALPVHRTGESLAIRTSARAQIDFAEVHFGNGQVQVVDFNERLVEPGTFRLIDFPGASRNVEAVRIVARARAPRASITVLLH